MDLSHIYLAVRDDTREDNETVIESTIDEEISSSVATRSMFPFIF